MPESPIKLQDAAYKAMLRRQDIDYDSGIDTTATSLDNSGRQSPVSLPRNDSINFDTVIRPQRPRLDFRFSNQEVTHLTHDGASDAASGLRALPTQVAPERAKMTAFNPPKNVYRITSLNTWAFTSGFSDSVPGTILHLIQAQYGISYTVVSLIWMSNAVGFILVACFAHKVQAWFGREMSLVVGACFSVVMYAIVLSGTKFPLIVVAFFIGGIGLAAVLAQANVFLSRIENQSKYLSWFHGSYGIGATVGPLIATSIVNAGVAWHYVYLIILGMMLCNAGFYYYAFKGADSDLAPWDIDEHEYASGIASPEESIGMPADVNLQDLSGAEEPPKVLEGDHSELMGALRSPFTWIVAFFVLFYQGSEVSIAGWIVTFLLEYRKGPSSVGYVASGFWGGLTIGRIVFTEPLHKYFGARRSVIVVSLLAILMVILTWTIPHLLVDGVVVSFAGFFIGPNYPLAITLCADLFPRKIQVVSLTIVTAFGSSGGALFPFIIGLMSQSFGPFIVLPAFIVLYSLMLILWVVLPNRERQLKGQVHLTWLQRLW